MTVRVCTVIQFGTYFIVINNGILTVRLERQVPEALKPRRIAIRN